VVFIGLSLVLGLWAYTKANGEEVTVCVRSNGLMHVIGEGFRRTECRRNETLLSWDMHGEKGDTGEQGEKGEKGDKGDMGEPGTPLTQSDFYRVESPFMSVPRNSALTTGVGCADTNDIAISGGPDYFDCPNPLWRTISNRPNPFSLDSWHVEVALGECPGFLEGRMVVYAVCLRVPGP